MIQSHFTPQPKQRKSLSQIIEEPSQVSTTLNSQEMDALVLEELDCTKEVRKIEKRNQELEKEKRKELFLDVQTKWAQWLARTPHFSLKTEQKQKSTNNLPELQEEKIKDLLPRKTKSLFPLGPMKIIHSFNQPVPEFAHELAFEIKLSTKQESGVSKSELNQMQVIGQYGKSVILVKFKDRLLAIDQHAAHQRVLLEAYMDQARKDLKLRESKNIQQSERRKKELVLRKQVDLNSPLHLKYDQHQVIIHEPLKKELIIQEFSAIELIRLHNIDQAQWKISFQILGGGSMKGKQIE